MNWQEEFDKRFGKAGPQKNSDSLNESAGCDDCSWCIEIRDEHKAFISTLIEKIIEEAFSKIDHPCWKDNSHSHGVDMSDWEQQLRDKWLGKEQE